MRMYALAFFSGAILLGFNACTAGDGRSDGNAGGNSGSGASSGTLSGPGGFNQTGGSGSGGVDECQSISQEAKPKLEAADIIFVIDTSGSMGEESFFVRQNMNAFSQQIIAAGVDVKVIMLAEPQLFPCFGTLCPPGVCIDAPLGSGACPADENLPMYAHPPSEIGSTDALTQIIDLYPSYAQHLRPNVLKYVVIITDDNATAPYIDNAATFIQQFTALDPANLTGFKTHGIYCPYDGNGCASVGTVYTELINLTNGIHGDLSLQDFQPIFNDLATQVVVDAGELPCTYIIPPPPPDETFDPQKVNVTFTDGNGTAHDILKVASEADCHPTDGGWYYNNDAMPTAILICPASCDLVSGDPLGKIDIVLGCQTKLADPE